MQYIVYVVNTNETLKPVCRIFSTPHCIVPRASRGNLSQGQELVLPLLLPADKGEQVSPGEGREAAQLICWPRAKIGSHGQGAGCSSALYTPSLEKEEGRALTSSPREWAMGGGVGAFGPGRAL